MERNALYEKGEGMTPAPDTEETLVQLIQEVKPSLRTVEIHSTDSIPDRLGLDSLDLLQLSRRVRRKFGKSFDLDEWTRGLPEHHGSVQSMVDLLVQTNQND
ncbi:phosphopantetheine-binding protein [uncultured Propionibacterium sp.]|uniref:phosphopantetheine-binding protein n=1 Tax=uncultured Propionibacterium sp. TaxID=218066 RepID=UPI002930D27C|nr:phosphopantetheine-binding protein [uncultured Propionibacterium sp.]